MPFTATAKPITAEGQILRKAALAAVIVIAPCLFIQQALG
jgi:hypothetical protein